MYILGISAFYHDSAACLVKDGEIVAAAQEERFTRKKHDHEFPSNAIQYCLKEAGIDGTEIEFVAYIQLVEPCRTCLVLKIKLVLYKIIY